MINYGFGEATAEGNTAFEGEGNGIATWDPGCINVLQSSSWASHEGTDAYTSGYDPDTLRECSLNCTGDGCGFASDNDLETL